MPKKPGFTILGVILYLSCLTVFALNICMLANYALAFCSKIGATQRNTLATHSAIMLLKRDVLQASNNILDWQTNPLVFKRTRLLNNGSAQHRWISWKQEEKGWRRIMGQYDTFRKKWLSRKSKLFTCPLKQLSLTPVFVSKNVTSAQLSYLDSKKEKINDMIQLKNKYINL